ncbi:MAG: hypothetical protein ACI9DC_003419 [Gammaproteobacteria bacterium]|jgi:uncharacterized protein (DUF934 family)
MDIIRNRTIQSDQWRYELDAVDQISTADIAPGDVIVSMQRWLDDHERLLARGTRVGVVLRPDDGLQALIDCELHELWLLAIEFPSFAEGRGYSYARLLRSRHDYHGGLRAIGDVSRDRIAFMERCGFNELELPAERSLPEALLAFSEIGEVYQPSTDALPSVARIRGYRIEPSVRSAA